MKKLKRKRRGSTTSKLPAVRPAEDGSLMISAGKYARNAVLTVFDQLGGADAMKDWAEANPTDFYTKLFSKTITREVEPPKQDDFETLLSEAIEAEVQEVPSQAQDADFEDVPSTDKVAEKTA